MNLPNALTILRIFFVPLLVAALVQDSSVFRFGSLEITNDLLSLAIFLAAAGTDLLDGYLARRWKQVTTIGTLLDPIADKVLLSGVYVSLAAAGSIPWALVLIILGRDLLLLASSGIALLFTEYRQFRPSFWGKASTFVQIACATAWMAQNAINSSALHVLAQTLVWPTAALTIWSGLHYSWRGMRLLRAH